MVEFKTREDIVSYYNQLKIDAELVPNVKVDVDTEYMNLDEDSNGSVCCDIQFRNNDLYLKINHDYVRVKNCSSNKFRNAYVNMSALFLNDKLVNSDHFSNAAFETFFDCISEEQKQFIIFNLDRFRN